MNISILNAKKGELQALDDAITEYNIKIVPDLPRAVLERLDFVAKNINSTILGGIQAMMVNWGILQIELLYINEPYRKSGIGSLLLKYVEDIAIKNGCHLSHLDTFDFQGKDFYLKHGYEIFGILENAPKGHCRYYLKKQLNKI